MTVQELYSKIGNYEEAKRRLMNDKLIAKFAVRFLHDPTYGQLTEALEKGDGEEIFKAAHTLKGVCANLALSKLAELASVVTEAYRPGQNFRPSDSDISEAVQNLKERYEETVEEIKKYESEQ